MNNSLRKHAAEFRHTTAGHRAHPNQPDDTVFEIDTTTRNRLNTVSITEYPHNAVLSAFLDSAPDDHTPEVLLTNVTRGDQSLMSEQGPDLIGGVVTVDDVTFTTLPSLTSGASATSQFRCRALLDTGSPQSFIHQGVFEQMVATGAADESYVRSTTPRSWSGFGSQESLNTNRQARLTVQFYHNDTPSASLAVWIYIVPNRTMRCPLLLGRDSWMRFHSRSYKHSRLHLMVAFSVNLPYHTLLTTLITALPRTSGAAKQRTLYIT